MKFIAQFLRWLANVICRDDRKYVVLYEYFYWVGPYHNSPAKRGMGYSVLAVPSGSKNPPDTKNIELTLTHVAITRDKIPVKSLNICKMMEI